MTSLWSAGFARRLRSFSASSADRAVEAFLALMPASRAVLTAAWWSTFSSSASSCILIFFSFMLLPPRAPFCRSESGKSCLAGLLFTDIPASSRSGLVLVQRETPLWGQCVAQEIGFQKSLSADDAHAHRPVGTILPGLRHALPPWTHRQSRRVLPRHPRRD